MNMTTNGVRYNSGRAYFQTESVARRFSESVPAHLRSSWCDIMPWRGGWVVAYWMVQS